MTPMSTPVAPAVANWTSEAFPVPTGAGRNQVGRPLASTRTRVATAMPGSA